MFYTKLARFYDPVIGDRRDTAVYISDLLERYRTGTRTVLELACGTGAVLGLLSESYEVTGLDRSRSMLAIARKKLPHVELYRQNVTSFELNRRFDAVICVFDSINHLTRFTDWQQVFRRVNSHLNDRGLFIFDVNTTGRLRRLSHSPPWTTAFGKNWEIITVAKGRRGIFNWHVRVLEHRRGNDYKLHAETIPELTVPMKRIKAGLKPLFKKLRVIDPEGARPSDRSGRLYFVCQK
jgi:SAM-dependent methyltransferase